MFSRCWLWIMPSFGIWRRVYLVWTDVSEERRVTQSLHGATFQKTAFFLMVLDEIQNCHIQLVSGEEYKCRRNFAHDRVVSEMLCLLDDWGTRKDSERRGRGLTEFQICICPEELRKSMRTFRRIIWWPIRDSIPEPPESPTAIPACPVNSKKSAHNVLISTERLGMLLLFWDILSSTLDTEVDYPESLCYIRRSIHARSRHCIVARTEAGGEAHLPAVTRSDFWDPPRFWGMMRPMLTQILGECSWMTIQE
jgi:hypothetical protein